MVSLRLCYQIAHTLVAVAQKPREHPAGNWRLATVSFHKKLLYHNNQHVRRLLNKRNTGHHQYDVNLQLHAVAVQHHYNVNYNVTCKAKTNHKNRSRVHRVIGQSGRRKETKTDPQTCLQEYVSEDSCDAGFLPGPVPWKSGSGRAQ